MATSQELAGKVALVTGAGSGIGKAAAVRLAQAGAAVALLSRTEKELRAVEQEITAAGGKALVLVTDVSDEADMRAAVAKTVETFGALHIVFANAGINGTWAPIDDLRPDEWDKTIAVNLRGTYLTAHLTVPHLKAAGGGAFLITSSINGTRTFSNTGATAYSTTKAGQVAFAQMLALELAKFRIRVNVICPGRIETEINQSTTERNLEEVEVPVEFPEGKIPLTGDEPGTSEQVAELVLFLASPRAQHITGTPVWIDGAQSLLVG